MVVFPEIGFFEIVRTIFVVLTAGFLPGLFVYATILRKSNLLEMLKSDFVEAVTVSLITSIVLLALLSVLLTFSIGFSAAAIAACEVILTIGCWKIWKTKTG